MPHDVSDDRISNPGANPAFSDIVDQALSRRSLIKSGLGAAAIGFIGLNWLTGCSGGDDGGNGDGGGAAAPESMLGFAPVATATGDAVVVPAGYVAQAILPWGDPIDAGAPAWDPALGQDAAAQERQIGDNHDGMTFFALDASGTDRGGRSDAGLLAINHEYINPEYFYAPGSDAADWLVPFDLAKARRAQAAHGVSVVAVRRKADGSWEHDRASPLNRRITGYSPTVITGPAAGHALMRTAADPSGTVALGTLNNCANGSTPWGTYLTCEENFNGYFGWNGSRTPSALESRYGLTKDGFGYRWHTVDARFDLNAEPNEANRFGWVVEIDPFDPTATPKKRTALGRFKHENAALAVAPSGKVVVYLGDDERNEYIYKFVSSGTFDARNPGAAAHRNLLDHGTLYVARFDAGATAGDRMGTGVWIPLVFGENGLTEANGFTSQADVLIRARQAADRVGATMMDRPEWIAIHPARPGEGYCTLTNNNRRGSSPASGNAVDGTTAAGSARPPADEANPRAVNNWGHIIRWREAGGDPTATTFAWDLFLIAGNPAKFPGTDKAGSATITSANMFNSPDGLGFDAAGRLWIQTDGSYANSGDFEGQGNNQMLAADAATGEVRRFLVGPSGCEITGLTFTPDRRTMFINVQHPGEVGSHPNKPAGYAGDNWIARNPAAFSTWPGGAGSARPRAATVAIRRVDGGIIGAGPAVAAVG